MRLALLIKTLGATPVPSSTPTFFPIRRILKKQYQQLKRDLGPKVTRKWRETLRPFVPEPRSLPPSANSCPSTRSHRNGLFPTIASDVSAGGSWFTPTSSPPSTMPTNSQKREEKQTYVSIPVSSVMEFLSDIRNKEIALEPLRSLHTDCYHQLRLCFDFKGSPMVYLCQTCFGSGSLSIGLT